MLEEFVLSLILSNSNFPNITFIAIRVNALLPGTILTPFVENYLKNSYDNPDAAIETIKKRQLSGELGRPEDVAQAALFLASDESKFMMGSPLYIDGGVTFGKNA
jgi:NAD(P)-dependent dehydrogenase (short-subunit alcohol dehydrogenase family)